jgi:hypothetical protein
MYFIGSNNSCMARLRHYKLLEQQLHAAEHTHLEVTWVTSPFGGPMTGTTHLTVRGMTPSQACTSIMNDQQHVPYHVRYFKPFAAKTIHEEPYAERILHS